jgi:hypothetical protein
LPSGAVNTRPMVRSSIGRPGRSGASWRRRVETLGDLSAARGQAELVITLRDGNHVRSRAFGQLRLAGILLAQGEIDHACTITVDALQHSGGVSSRRVSQLVRSLHISLTPHAGASEAQPAAGALAAALARPDPLDLITTTHSLDT